MTTALVDSPENEQRLEWSLLDTLVVERQAAPEMDAVVRETRFPLDSTLRLDDFRPTRQPGRLEARWVPDPRDAQALICIWVPSSSGLASPPGLDR